MPSRLSPVPGAAAGRPLFIFCVGDNPGEVGPSATTLNFIVAIFQRMAPRHQSAVLRCVSLLILLAPATLAQASVISRKLQITSKIYHTVNCQQSFLSSIQSDHSGQSGQSGHLGQLGHSGHPGHKGVIQVNPVLSSCLPVFLSSCLPVFLSSCLPVF